MNLNHLKRNRAFSMVEMVVYVAIVAVVLLAIMDVVMVISKSNKQSTVYNNIKNSAIFGLERIIKETKFSTDIDLGQSVFNSPDGILVLNSKDEDGLVKVIKFYLDEGLIKMDVDGNYSGPVTYSDTKVSNLVFVPIDTGNSQAVKIEIDFGVEGSSPSVSEEFYSTVVLRNSY